MSASRARRRTYPGGMALYGSGFLISLVLIAVSVGLVVMAVTRDAPLELLVSSLGLLVFAGAISLFTGAAVFYQARPLPRSPVRGSVVWDPPPVSRAAIVVMLVAVTTITVAFTTVGPTPMEFLLIGTALLITWSVGARALVARFEADRWGIRCTNPFTTVRIPWSDVESLEPRGKSILAQRVVAVTKHGRERMLWVFDPRIPASTEAARLVVAELEAVWQLAATRRPDGID
jgi:Bacterial PH domain